MSAFAFRADQKLTEVLAQRSFTFSAEVIPPRNGAEQVKVLGQIEQLIEAGSQFLAVTKGAGGSLRGGSLPIAQTIKERFGVPCIAHFTCRDLTPHDVENQLIDHHYFGIRNILALRGDPPQGHPDWKPRDGGYSYAYQLIEQIKNLNQGKYLVRPGGPPSDGSEKADFCIGAAVYPEHPIEDERARFFKLKVEAGAEYGITDMIFDPEAYARFLELCSKNSIRVPVLPGTRLLRTRSQAQRMAAKFRCSVPAELLNRLPDDESASSEAGIDALLTLSERLKSYGAPGLHVYVISDTAGACAALRKLTR
jgi:methylenetetrahydrofolate reductase (NADPH)